MATTSSSSEYAPDVLVGMRSGDMRSGDIYFDKDTGLEVPDDFKRKFLYKIVNTTTFETGKLYTVVKNTPEENILLPSTLGMRDVCEWCGAEPVARSLMSLCGGWSYCNACKPNYIASRTSWLKTHFPPIFSSCTESYFKHKRTNKKRVMTFDPYLPLFTIKNQHGIPIATAINYNEEQEGVVNILSKGVRISNILQNNADFLAMSEAVLGMSFEEFREFLIAKALALRFRMPMIFTESSLTESDFAPFMEKLREAVVQSKSGEVLAD